MVEQRRVIQVVRRQRAPDGQETQEPCEATVVVRAAEALTEEDLAAVINASMPPHQQGGHGGWTKGGGGGGSSTGLYAQGR